MQEIYIEGAGKKMLTSRKKGEAVGRWKNIMILIVCTTRHEELMEHSARISSNKKFKIAGYI